MDELARNIATGGTFGLILALVVAVWAFATGRVRPGSVVDRNEARLLAERDEAIALARSYGDQFERALDIIEGKQP